MEEWPWGLRLAPHSFPSSVAPLLSFPAIITQTASLHHAFRHDSSALEPDYHGLNQ